VTTGAGVVRCTRSESLRGRPACCRAIRRRRNSGVQFTSPRCTVQLPLRRGTVLVPCPCLVTELWAATVKLAATYIKCNVYTVKFCRALHTHYRQGLAFITKAHQETSSMENGARRRVERGPRAVAKSSGLVSAESFITQQQSQQQRD